MKRRTFLKWGGLTLSLVAGGLTASAGTLSPPVVVAGDQTLVVVFLRGGLDGMHALVPYTSPEYYEARPNLAVPGPGKQGSLELDEQFALHPALEPLHQLYLEKQLGAVCAVGTSNRSRSHFLAQDFLEYGGLEKRRGWLNRYLAEDQLALSTRPHLPGLLKGEHPVLNVSSLDGLLALEAASPAELTATEKDFKKRLSGLRAPLENPYPNNALAQQLRTVSCLIKQGVELKAAHCEVSGFDTHSRQIDGLWPGNLFGLNRLLYDVAQAISTFWRDLGDHAERVTLITLTEFGRRLHENASLGTDHGLASVSFVLGSRVVGGKVYGQWPGLHKEALIDGIDLAVTTDYRQLLNEYTRAVDGKSLFADFQGSGVGCFTSA